MKTFIKLTGAAALLLVLFAACSNPFWPGKDKQINPIDQPENPKDLSGSITITPNTNVIIGMELTAVYSGNETVSYQWKKDGTNVGTNSDKYTPTQEGSYTVTVSAEGYHSKTSAVVDVNDPSLLFLSGTITITPNTDVTIGTELTAVYNGSETVNYHWEKDGESVGINSNKFTPTEAGSYTVTVSAEGYNHKTSAAVVVSNPAPKEYTIEIDMIDNETGDTVTVSPNKGIEGNKVTLSYTVANTAHYNQLDFGGVDAHIASVESAGSGERTYTIHAADSSNGVITITAVFTHTDLEIDHIAFSEHNEGHITKTYGDAAFTNAVTDAHQGKGAITYHSSDTSVATVNSSGQVTILKAGSAVISAEKAADDKYAHAQTTYTLTVNPKPVTITGLSASNKTYDGTATATASGTAVIDGKVGSDDVTVIAGTAVFADAAAENNKPVTFSGYSLGGADAGNYTLSAQPASVTANILPNGSVPAPFLVSNEAELRKVGSGRDGWTRSVNYRQIASFTMTGDSFTPIGNGTNRFTGSYNGDGFIITGLTVTGTTNDLGLFGYIDRNGTVKNVTIYDGAITQNGSNTTNTGGIAGANEGTISNCSFSGTVTGDATTVQVGGIAGYNFGTVINSRNNANVNGRGQIGGITGTNYGEIENSYNTGSVTGYGSVGGISGVNTFDDVYIKNCYNTGNVTASGSNVGGIVGLNDGGALTEYCYNTGNVSGADENVGGIAGSNDANSGTSSIVRNCVSLGAKVTISDDNIGRVIGLALGTMTGNYARADMKIGKNGAEATVSTGAADDQNGADVALNTAQTTVFSGWDTAIWNISGNLTVNGALPTLKTNPQSPAPTLPAEYLVPNTETNPFLVATEADLRKVGTGADGWTLSAYYKQTANITVTGDNFTAIGDSTTKFTGSYDGDGKTITDLSITGTTSNLGLFGYIGTGGTVKNMNVTGTITQNGSDTTSTGGIAGANEGMIDNCVFAGTVDADDCIQVGGIVGLNKGTVKNSTNKATVTGDEQVGGIAGRSEGRIEKCKNEGSFSGNAQTGGFAGVNTGQLVF